MNPDVALTLLCVSVALNVGLGYAWLHAARSARRHRADTLAAPDEDRLARVEQALDALAVQNDRLAEGQDFLGRVVADRLSPPMAKEGRRQEEITPH